MQLIGSKWLDSALYARVTLHVEPEPRWRNNDNDNVINYGRN